ncbi:MAG TPA: phospholipase D-like domain-containing protein [Gemmatimonadaceae bacterium]
MAFGIVGFVLAGLIFGVIFLAGLLSAVKGTPVRDVRALGQDRPPSVDEKGFREGIELVSRTALAPGHRIEVFVNGDQTYPRLWDDLRAAKRAITMQMYYCQKGRMAETLREILVERARAGVAVYLLYDAFGSSFPKEYIAALKQGGVNVAPFRPLSILGAHKLQHRAHIRVVCVDGCVGYTGGFGISDKWFGNGLVKDQWRDTNVRFTGPAVGQLQAAFVACWAEATGHMLVGETLFPLDGAEKNDGVVAGVLHGSPSVGSTEAERFLTLSIASARRRLYITNSYFVPDKDIRNLIADAARRGVDTRVLTAGSESDVKSTLYAGRARYEELLEAGVRVYEYRDTMMHAKSLVVDGRWAAVGSMNADNRSLSFNEETVLMMLDETLGAELERQFLRDLEHSDEIQLDAFRRRGAWERTKEHATHLVWRVL